MMDNNHRNGKPKLAKDTRKGIVGIFTRLWVKLNVKKVALLEQIREHPNTPALKDQNDTMAFCITKVAKDLGLNTG